MTIKFQSSLFPCFSWFCGKPTLLMPTLVIDDNTELILRNFIAYEQSFPKDHFYFTSYACAMKMLIDAQDDVAKLVESGVLVNNLGSNQETADMINNICKHISLTEFYYTQEFKQMDSYYKGYLPRNIAALRHRFYHHGLMEATKESSLGNLVKTRSQPESYEMTRKGKAIESALDVVTWTTSSGNVQNLIGKTKKPALVGRGVIMVKMIKSQRKKKYVSWLKTSMRLRNTKKRTKSDQNQIKTGSVAKPRKVKSSYKQIPGFNSIVRAFASLGHDLGNVEDNILVPKLPKNYARCTRCGYLVDGPNCHGCALLLQELEEHLVTHYQDFQNTFEPSNANTNVVNAPREPYVVKQDNGSFVDKIIFYLNRALDSPHLHTISPNQFHCFYCKDVLKDGEACKRCTCAKCGSGLGKGLCYICGHNQNSLNDSPSISETSSQSPPNINYCCFECGDPLDGIFCKRCTCKSCGKDAHIGYNCPSEVLVISNPKP
nr:putative UPF0481 protein At3g02645 [Tanacetum cinerariifolium]